MTDQGPISGDPVPEAEPTPVAEPTVHDTPAPAAPVTPSPAAPVTWTPPTMEAGPAPGIAFAPHGQRLVAYVIDGLIVGIVVSVLTLIGMLLLFRGVSIDPSTGDIDPSSISAGSVIGFVLLIVVGTLLSLLYFPFFWARGGQTPGMRPFGLVVVRDRDGAPIGWGTALLRLVGMYVAYVVFYVGFIWIFIDKRRRGWQDLIAGTIVVKRP